MEISSSIFGRFEGDPVEMYSLDNGAMQVRVINFGAIIQSIILRTQSGDREVVLNYPTLEGYVHDKFYIGAVVGRFANRINNARFQLHDRTITLSMNEPMLNNHIHGGVQGFNRKMFTTDQMYTGRDELTLSMHYDSSDGEEGYPGKLRTTVKYTLDSTNELVVEFFSIADADTHVNLTQHSYFNLNADKLAYAAQYLQLNSRAFLESDERYLPTGRLLPVMGNRFDFTTARKIFENNDSDTVPLFNTWYAIENNDRPFATVESHDRSVAMQVSTSYPGVLLYSGDFLQEPFEKCSAICLECQFPPDAPNRPELPSTFLKEGQEYHHYIKYKFQWQQ